MTDLKETRHLSIPDNASEDTVKGIMLALNITLDTLGVDKHTGRRVLENIKGMSKEHPEYSEVYGGMMRVHDYIKNQIVMNEKIYK